MERKAVDLVQTPISIDEVIALVVHPGAGAVDVFTGIVRDHADGRAVTSLEYSAYDPMARRELAAIVTELEQATPGVRVAVRHRLGLLAVGEIAVVCAASAPHRGDAFAACRATIDAVKARVPIWKRETGPSGAHWVGWTDARR